MIIDIDNVQHLYENGLMPDWAYYQLNGRSASVNYREQLFKLQNRVRQIQQEKELANYKAILQAELEQQIEEKMYIVLEKTINDLFREWQ